MYPEIYHLERIGRGSLSVMAKPVSGEWIEDEFSGIAKYGINRVVSLLEYSESFEVGLAEERELVEKNCMEYLSYPIPDRGLPMSVKEFSQFTRQLYDDTATGLNTVIHCRAGIGRTGIVAAGILLHGGFEPLQAFDFISEKRGVSVPDTQEQIDWVNNNYSAIVNS